MEETYVYTVVPKRPIRGVVKGKIITKESNLFLTKDEVLLCLKHGPVYRKFYHPDKPEKVTPSNLDRLHRAEHLTEEQYNALLEKESVDEEEPEVQEEVVEESPVEEDVEVEEPAEEVEVIEADVDTEDVDDEVKKVEEEQSSTESEEQTVEDVVLPKKSSSSKKKKKKTRTATSVTAVPETPQEEEQ